MNEPDVRRFMCHPLTMIASDGGPRAPNGELTHPRSYGNNARVLGRYVRELKPLTLEAAVRKMTPLPARTFRLEGRGELKPGAAADIVVFDPDRVADQATFDQPRAYAVGFSDVFVNGTAVLRNETLTGEHPGKPVRLAPASRQDGLETANRARRQPILERLREDESFFLGHDRSFRPGHSRFDGVRAGFEPGRVRHEAKVMGHLETDGLVDGEVRGHRPPRAVINPGLRL